MMKTLLRLAHLVDEMNGVFGRVAVYLVLAACLISAGNAGARYALGLTSNAWLEVQWYMFGGIVMLGCSYTLKVNEHVRVDLVYGRLASRTRAWVDLLGTIVFLLPATGLGAILSWRFFWQSFLTGEVSANAGGLIRWPFKLLLPIGFALLTLQGLAEIVKRIGYLKGVHRMDTDYQAPLQ
jgi:TRAP-type mannitol/chloroaromatic compound transport system permease small subunit